MGMRADILHHVGWIREKDTEACCTASTWETLETSKWALHPAKWLSSPGSKGSWLPDQVDAFQNYHISLADYSWQE